MVREPKLLRLRMDESGSVWLLGNGYCRELDIQELAELVQAIRRARCRQANAPQTSHSGAPEDKGAC